MLPGFPVSGGQHDLNLAESLDKYSTLVVRTSAVLAFGATLSKEDNSQSKPLDPRAETAYLNIIGGLLGLMLSNSPSGKPQSVFKNQAAIISSMEAHYPNKYGLSEENLQKKFADAKKSLKN